MKDLLQMPVIEFMQEISEAAEELQAEKREMDKMQKKMGIRKRKGRRH